MTFFTNQRRQDDLSCHLSCDSTGGFLRVRIQPVPDLAKINAAGLGLGQLRRAAASARVTRVVSASYAVVKIEQILNIAVFEPGRYRHNRSPHRLSRVSSEIRCSCGRIARCRLHALAVRYIAECQVGALRLINRSGWCEGGI